MSNSDQCLKCARFRGVGTCAAFPDGIPGEIMSGEFDHEKPHVGDHGLRFKPRSDDAAENERAAYPEFS